MREIKFRAWHKKMQRMYEVLTLDLEHLMLTSPCRDGCETGIDGFSFDEVELMRFIGRHDRNGKEIYEGDILGHPFRGPMLVEWGHLDNGEDESDCYGWVGNQDWDERTVIGNIYQHPELLEMGK